MFHTAPKSHKSVRYPDIWTTRKKDWVAVYNKHIKEVIIGRVVHKYVGSSTIIVEHFQHSASNTNISPDSSEIHASKCRGCTIHSASLNPIHYTSCSKIFSCIAPYPNFIAVTIPKIKRISEMEYFLKTSFFALKQQALDLYAHNTEQAEIERIHIFNILETQNEVQFRHEEYPSEDSIILKHIEPLAVAQQLLYYRNLFAQYHELEFYTDGSFDPSNSPNVEMGCAWIETTDSDKHRFITKCQNFASSSRAEAFAILTALSTAPSGCHVTIVTDSAVCIQQIHNIQNKDYKWNKMTNQVIWIYIAWLISTLKLNVTMTKVKAHSGDVFNELSDQLAKDGCKSNYPVISINESFNNLVSIMKWGHNTIELQNRLFIKTMTQAQYFNQFLALQRNEKLYSLTVQDEIDWKSTFLYQKYNGPADETNFEMAGLKMFKVKCLTMTLPTISILKTRHPHLYNNHTWTCPNMVETTEYGNILVIKRCMAEETFEHLWNCKAYKEKIKKMVGCIKLHIIHEVKKVCPTASLAHLKEKLD